MSEEDTAEPAFELLRRLHGIDDRYRDIGRSIDQLKDGYCGRGELNRLVDIIIALAGDVAGASAACPPVNRSRRKKATP